MKGLVIREPYVDWIVDGLKAWEIRGSGTRVRGTIALIKSGSGTIVGTCELTGSVGPLSLAELRANAEKLNRRTTDVTSLPYERTHAWVLANARRLPKPIRYDHPQGAVIWVVLADAVSRAVKGQRGLGR